MMKRSTKIILVIILLLIIILWASTFQDLFTILIPYILIALIISIHAAYSILSSVFSLKDHPEQKKKLNQDIKRSLKFYQENGLRLHTKVSET